MSARPLVGLLHNPAIPHVADHCGSLLEAIEVIPDRLWYDNGVGHHSRFRRVEGPIAALRRCAQGRVVIGHGIGLSLPSAMPIDEALLAQVAAMAQELEMESYSEHLSMFLAPHGSVPNAQAGLGLPIGFDREMVDLLAAKVGALHQAVGVPISMENGTIFSPVPDPDMTEPAFINELHRRAGCGLVLDLHNLYANVVNNGVDAAAYLAELDLAVVTEIHLAGGDELLGFYTDSHSRPTPRAVMAWAADIAPRCPNLRALIYEFHESYTARLGLEGIIHELEQMHEIADLVDGDDASRGGGMTSLLAVE